MERQRISHLAFRFLEIAFGFLFLWVVSHHVITRDIKPLAAYGLLRYFGAPLESREPWSVPLLLLVFLMPYALMQIGLICFMRAVWVIVPQFVRPVGALEVVRRVHQPT